MRSFWKKGQGGVCSPKVRVSQVRNKLTGLNIIYYIFQYTNNLGFRFQSGKSLSLFIACSSLSECPCWSLVLVDAGQMEEEGGRHLTEHVLQHHHEQERLGALLSLYFNI